MGSPLFRTVARAGFNRVIDVDEVAALIVLTLPGNETVDIPVSK